MPKNSLLSVLLALGAVLLITAKVAAAPPTGIAVSPFLQSVTIGADQAQRTFNISFTNHTDHSQALNLEVKDFGSLNDTGGIAIQDNTDYSRQYGLASWLSLETNSVVLAPGETSSVPVTIDNRSSLEPGGHYGAIIANVENDDNPSSRNNVQLHQQLTALVLADKVGGEHYDLRLRETLHNGNWLHTPSKVRLRFQNPSNIHVIPRGTVLLKSSSGRVLARGVINSESAFILPESYRQLYVPLIKDTARLRLPGTYHIEVNYRYEGLATTAQKRINIHFINLPFWTVIIIILWLVYKYFRRPPTGWPKIGRNSGH